MRRQSKAELYAHMACATTGRARTLTGPLQRAVHRCIVAEAQSVGCGALAISGMPDHIQVALRMPASVAPADLARRVK